MSTPLPILDANRNAERITVERQSQRLVIAFVLTGLFFLLLPGTFLGVWNLIDISELHRSSALPPAWLQAHGQAQIFGWIGSFILGIGLYSLTKTQSTMSFPERVGWGAWGLWTLGVALRWIAGIVKWEWRVLLPLSGLLQLIAFFLFFYAVRRYGPKGSATPEPWMRMIMASSLGFLLTLVINCGLLLWLAFAGSSPALPHGIDQAFVVLAVWGIVVPTIWGFNARWASCVCRAQANGWEDSSLGLWVERCGYRSSHAFLLWRRSPWTMREVYGVQAGTRLRWVSRAGSFL